MSDLTAASLWSFDHRAGVSPGSAAGGAEVAAFDAARGLVLVLGPDGVDALDAATGALRFSLPKTELDDLGSGNSTTIGGDLVAVAFGGAEDGGNGTVPSPPAATTIRTAHSAASRANAVAWPRQCVSATSTRTPWPASTSRTRHRRRERRLPAAGLKTTSTCASRIRTGEGGRVPPPRVRGVTLPCQPDEIRL